jgi:hypothetical protein
VPGTVYGIEGLKGHKITIVNISTIKNDKNKEVN